MCLLISSLLVKVGFILAAAAAAQGADSGFVQCFGHLTYSSKWHINEPEQLHV